MPEPNFPDFKELFYDQQARLADTIDQLRNLVIKMQNDMRIAEELVVADENEPEE
ncbi:MAG: hypothetical protein HDT22_04950 [Ruminococcus sp.]|nr:hypothetical protein [Ruminococcus sp.]